MPNVHLTQPMEAYARNQIRSGAYANLSEVVRAGVRLLMERDGARQFYALKEDLEEAVREAEAGGFEEFDPEAYPMNRIPTRDSPYGDQAVPVGAARSG
ncbi:MAG: type II toxin-antitoxin system ParD family antitoxin [Rhodospirillaceae bacterium]|nr:type II toxin-antitoxin system ParD family antitoxin [Rhodospirillaceae bacterium]